MTYSAGVDALAIRLVSGARGVGTVELTPDVFVDFDQDRRLVGLEVLNASRYYDRSTLGELPTPAVWLSLAEASAESGIAPTTLKTQIARGRIPAEKRGRDWYIAKHELWNYLESRAPAGRPGKAPRAELPSKGSGKVVNMLEVLRASVGEMQVKKKSGSARRRRTG